MLLLFSSSVAPLACAHYLACTVFSQPFFKHVLSFCCTLVFRLRGFSDGEGRVPDVLESLEMDN